MKILKRFHCYCMSFLFAEGYIGWERYYKYICNMSPAKMTRKFPYIGVYGGILINFDGKRISIGGSDLDIKEYPFHYQIFADEATKLSEALLEKLHIDGRMP